MGKLLLSHTVKAQALSTTATQLEIRFESVQYASNHVCTLYCADIKMMIFLQEAIEM